MSSSTQEPLRPSSSDLPALPVFRPILMDGHQPSQSDQGVNTPSRAPNGPRPLPSSLPSHPPAASATRGDPAHSHPRSSLPKPPHNRTSSSSSLASTASLSLPSPASSSSSRQPRPRGRVDSFFGLDPPQVREPFESYPSPSPPSPPLITPYPTSAAEHPSAVRPSSFFGLDHLSPSDHPNQSGFDPRYTSNYSSPRSSSHLSHGDRSSQHHSQHRTSRASLRPHVQHRSTAPFVNRSSPVIGHRHSLEFDQQPSSNFPIPTAPLLDHSHLKPGVKAKLLNHTKTLELYRANAKKTNDPEVIFEFACFLMDVVREISSDDDDDRSTEKPPKALNEEQQHRRKSIFEPMAGKTVPGKPLSEKDKEKIGLAQEAIGLLQKLANRGHVQSQFLLADCYTKAIGTQPNLEGGLATSGGGATGGRGVKPDYDRAFPLFVLAAKHGHVEAMYRAGQCCEHGWGTRKERDKALQFYRKAAIAQHPLAMHRLGLADLNGDLGQPRKPKDGVKWLKRAAEIADVSNPKPLHELALLHERGLEHVVFVDFDYAVELLARAAELGYAPSAYKLGECYEYGRMGCPQDAALSIHYYNIAAQQNHKEACFALTAWYLVGSPGVLPQSDTEAYLWAKKAAEAGLAKAEYAVGYFTEVGIGTRRDEGEALDWFRKAAEHGDKRARDRIRNHSGSSNGTNRGADKTLDQRGSDSTSAKNREDCSVM